uniref:Uncharacterized protein n=1 Tax=Populus trichocarpa TaxID=3694 RepID=A0A3N7F7A3_POPTR
MKPMDFITWCNRGIMRATKERKAETVAIARARQGRLSRNSMTKQLHNSRHPTFLKNKTHVAHGFYYTVLQRDKRANKEKS